MVEANIVHEAWRVGVKQMLCLLCRWPYQGDEPAIRAAEFGVSSLSGYLLFYPKCLMDYQIGTIGVIVIAAVVVTALIGKWRSPFVKIDYPFDAIAACIDSAPLRQ